MIETVGTIVTILSALSSLVNHVIRSRQAEGKAVAPWLIGTGTVLNVGAVNLDKAMQLGKQLKPLKASAPKATE